jgi:hypothetical protein
VHEALRSMSPTRSGLAPAYSAASWHPAAPALSAMAVTSAYSRRDCGLRVGIVVRATGPSLPNFLVAMPASSLTRPSSGKPSQISRRKAETTSHDRWRHIAVIRYARRPYHHSPRLAFRGFGTTADWGRRPTSCQAGSTINAVIGIWPPERLAGGTEGVLYC